MLGPFRVADCTASNSERRPRTCVFDREIIVPNVDEFPGHIACSSASKSEIVVPIFNGGSEAFGVLDVDSDRLDDFSEVDREGLKRIVGVIERSIQSHTNSDKLE